MFDVAKHCFDLPNDFIDQYKDKQPGWGGLAYFVFKRTYARSIADNGCTEEYWQTCQRVVEGTFSIQKNHCSKNYLFWDDAKAQRMAQKMFERLWCFKWTPPGRGFWMMGTDYIVHKGAACLQNCGFVTTKYIDSEPTKWAEFLMDMSMVGVGVGFDVRGAGKTEIQTSSDAVVHTAHCQ